MRNYRGKLVGLLVVCCTSMPCKAAINVTGTEAFAETRGEVFSPFEGSEEWMDDDAATGVTDVSASITGSLDAMAEIAAAKGTGEADASVKLLGGGRFRLAGSVSVLLEQVETEGEGSGESIALSFLDFDLTSPGQIGMVMAANGDVGLIFDPMGLSDFVNLVVGTPLAIGSYQLFGDAFVDSEMDAGAGDQFSAGEFELDVTIVSNGVTVVPEPSSVFAWVIFATVFGMCQLTRFGREG